MSANNYIGIYQENLVWHATERDADNSHKMSFDEEYQSLEDAIRGANEYMKTEEVEYGLYITLPNN